jgi:hypothetical protein
MCSTKPFLMLPGGTRRSEDLHRLGAAAGRTLWFRYWEGQVSQEPLVHLCEINVVTFLLTLLMPAVTGPSSDGSLSRISTQCSLMRTCVGTHQWDSCEASSMGLRATMCSSSGCAGQLLPSDDYGHHEHVILWVRTSLLYRRSGQKSLLLWISEWSFRFHKTKGISWPAEQVLAS